MGDADLVLVSGGQKMAVIIDGTVNINVLDAELVLVSGGQKMAVIIDGTVNMNVKDTDLILVSGGQKMAVIDGIVKMNVQRQKTAVIIDGSDLAHAASHASVSGP